MNRFLRGISLYLLVAIVLIAIVSTFYSPSESRRQLEYYQFTRLLDQGQVAQRPVRGRSEA